MPTPVIIPLLNPNEPEAVLAGLLVQEGQQVEIDEHLATLETTKSTGELHAQQRGFIRGLRFCQGQMTQAGEILCYIAETQDWTPPEAGDAPIGRQEKLTQAPSGLRITKPALDLASKMEIDLTRLPANRLVTESVVRAIIEAEQASLASTQPSNYDPSAIVIYGGGGHGKTLIDLLAASDTFRIVGIIDDGIEPGTKILGMAVLGGSEILAQLRSEGIAQAVNAVGGIGDISVRVQVFRQLARAGFICPTVVHPSAFIEPSANLSPGSQVFAQSYVGSAAQVGFGCIINTGAIVSHDCVLGDYVNVSPGGILAGEVVVGEKGLIGMGVTVNLRVRIGPGARIGNGATIKEDVPENGIVRAGTIWP